MISYVVSSNPDDRILQRAANFLDDGKLVAFPTDSHWSIATSPYSKSGVDLLYKMKKVDHHKHFSLLCNSISQASKYAYIPDVAYRRIRSKLPGPYTFIFTPTNDLPRYIRDYKKDKEIGIRIPKSVLVNKLVEHLKHPLITTSISSEMLPEFFETEKVEEEGQYEIYSYQIEEGIGHQLAMIIDPGDFEFSGPSTIIDFSKDIYAPVVLREGLGECESFL